MPRSTAHARIELRAWMPTTLPSPARRRPLPSLFAPTSASRRIAAADWDALAGSDAALSHAFLRALHETGCASRATGWTPCYLTRLARGTLVGAMPLYAKTHSYGEYVFDWAWADAYRRYGHRYYPKLVAAIPFTPAPGPRLFAADAAVRAALLQAALEALRARTARTTRRAALLLAAHPVSHRSRGSRVRRRRHDRPQWRAVPLGEPGLSRLCRLPRDLQPRQAQEGEAGAAPRRGVRASRSRARSAARSRPPTGRSSIAATRARIATITRRRI